MTRKAVAEGGGWSDASVPAVHAAMEIVSYDGPPERRAAFEARVRRGHMIFMHVEAARLEMQREIAAAREQGLVEGAAMAAATLTKPVADQEKRVIPSVEQRSSISLAEAAVMEGCSPNALKKRIQKRGGRYPGLIPGEGRNYRFNPAALLAAREKKASR